MGETQLDLIEFKWTFTPAGLFEEPVDLMCEGRLVRVDLGQAIVQLELEGGQAVWELVGNAMHESLLTQFLAAEVFGHEAFTLSMPAYTRIRPDGGRDIFMRLGCGSLRVGPARVDATVTVSGVAIRDDRRDRIERRKYLAAKAGKHIGNGILDSVLRSYMAAVNDPGNELIHLYEIRDALGTLFGGETGAIKMLGISHSRWSVLGRLANNEPLREGRHRGQNPGGLRNATEGELNCARDIARSMVEGYISYLEAAAP